MKRAPLLMLFLFPLKAAALDLDRLLARHGFAEDAVGVLVETFDGAEAVAVHAPDRASAPASTLKLLTAIGVLERLGPEHRFATRLLARDEGRTVILQGGGDPELDLDGLMQLALTLQASGITTPERFVLDDTALPRLPILRADQPPEDGYNTGIGALTLAFNRARLKRGANGRRWTLPPLDERGPVWMQRQHLSELPIRDAGLHAARTFRRFAAMLGVNLPEPFRGQAFRADRELGRVWSKTVAELVQDMLLYSNNQLAEILGLAATEAPQLGASMRALQGTVAGLDPNGDFETITAPNHSGLAPEARLTPRQLVTLLRLGQVRHGLLAMLPVAGWSGSLQRRYDDEGQALRVWAKTGSLDYALALAGLVLPLDGRPLLIALMIADVDDRRAFDRIRPPTASMRRAADAWGIRARALRDAIVSELLTR